MVNGYLFTHVHVVNSRSLRNFKHVHTLQKQVTLIVHELNYIWRR